MQTAKKGDTVSVHYTGWLSDGTVFDSSLGGEPLTFELGSGEIIQGFDDAVTGMELGESKTVELEPSEAYGPYREELVFEVDRVNLPEGLEPEVGQRLQMRQPDRQPVIVIVTEVNEETITLDANHPLAGERLIFDIELVGIA
ncbi:MAG: peptidylprolyl isomerase [Chloroflexi bacterium]|nr:peptidylprolyl isomerase [Chloroflexota bacterium]